MAETTFELRELKSQDIFPMFKIMGKIGFKDLKDKMTPENTKDIMKLFSANQEEDQEINQDELISFVGFNVIAEIAETVISNLPSCEHEIYTLLGNLSGMKAKEIADLPMVTFAEMVIAVIQKEEFKDFFKVVSRLFK